MPEKRIAFPSGRHCGFVASVDRRVIRCASPPLARSSTYTCDWSSPSRRALNAIRRLSGLQSTPPSPALVFVRRRGSALPSLGTSQRSLTCSPSVYDGSVTLKTIQRPSGLMAGEPTRFMRKTSSWVMVWRCCAARGEASQIKHATMWVGRIGFIGLSPVDVGADVLQAGICHERDHNCTRAARLCKVVKVQAHFWGERHASIDGRQRWSRNPAVFPCLECSCATRDPSVGGSVVHYQRQRPAALLERGQGFRAGDRVRAGLDAAGRHLGTAAALFRSLLARRRARSAVTGCIAADERGKLHRPSRAGYSRADRADQGASGCCRGLVDGSP